MQTMKIDRSSPKWIKKELKRLKTLDEYEILDTPEDEYLNHITELASRICNTPISLITLLDDKRAWFKAKVGIEGKEAPKDIAFCEYAIEDNFLFEIKNTLFDERFKSNPLVVGTTAFRFYAGMPLSAPNGANMGTLCVIDIRERELSKDQRVSLEILSKSNIF